MDAYKEFTDIKVFVANASECRLVNVISDTVITCDLPLVDEKLLNDDGDALVQVMKS